MKRNTLNLTIDTITACLMGGMIATGLLLRWVLPAGSASRATLWGWGRHDWGDLHFYLAISIVTVILVHLAMHWRWVFVSALQSVPGCANRQPPRPLKVNLLGGALSLALLLSLAWFVLGALLEVREVHGAGRGPSDVQPALIIRGSMTLSEAASASGITVEQAARALGLPLMVSSDQRLGPLSAEYHFSMREARQRLEAARQSAYPPTQTRPSQPNGARGT